jgi:hypothetical protein
MRKLIVGVVIAVAFGAGLTTRSLLRKHEARRACAAKAQVIVSGLKQSLPVGTLQDEWMTECAVIMADVPAAEITR